MNSSVKQFGAVDVVASLIALAIIAGAGYSAVQFVKGGAVLAQPRKFLEGVAAIGILTMALLQVVKGLFPWRGHFQEFVVRTWIQRGLSQWKRPSDSATSLVGSSPVEERPRDASDIVREIRRLAVTNEEVMLFNLPIEQLCGQITAAAEALLDYPEGDESASKAGDSKKPTQHRGTGIENGQQSLEQVVWALAGIAGSGEAAIYRQQREDYLTGKKGSDAEGKFLAYRNRLSQRFQRNIDGLQIEVAQKWRKKLWVAALVLGIVLAGLGCVSFDSWQERIFFASVGGLSAGFTATVARDIVAMIEKFRR